MNQCRLVSLLILTFKTKLFSNTYLFKIHYSTLLIIINKSYIKMRYVPIITSLLNQMRYVPLITNLINETIINIYYIHYHLHIIIYLLHIINKMNQTSNHMNTIIFTWKPSDWGENHGSFTIFKNLLFQIQPWLGQQHLTIYFRRTHTPFIHFYFPAPTGRGSNPCKPTM